MITFDIKMPNAADVMKSEMAEIESNNTKKAQSVEAPRGGVMVRTLAQGVRHQMEYCPR